MVVEKSGRVPLAQPRSLYAFTTAIGERPFIVHAKTVRNATRAVIERVMADYSPDTGLTEKLMPKKGAYKRLDSVLRQLCDGVRKMSPMSDEAFVAAAACGRKRARYAAAVESLRLKGWSPKDAKVMAFLKLEKIDISVKSDPAPRVIQPRGDRYVVALGKYIKKAEKPLFKALDRMFTKHLPCDTHNRMIFKGVNAREQGHCIAAKWNRFLDPCAVSLDVTKFDKHVSIEALLFEHAIYYGIYASKYHRQLRAMLNTQLRNDCQLNIDGHKIRYKTEGCRMSGDPNTSLGNCLIMASLAIQYLREKRIDGEIVNNGDDTTVIMERKDLNKFSDELDSWFEEFGFRIVAEKPVFVLEKIEFCQTHPVMEADGGYIMCRHPEVCVVKDLCSVKSINSSGAHDFYRRAIGMSGKALANNMPILGSMYRAMRRNTSHKCNKVAKWIDPEQTGMAMLAKGMRARSKNVADCTRLSFARAFNIDPHMQVLIEEYYDSQDMRYGNGPINLGDWPMMHHPYC